MLEESLINSIKKRIKSLKHDIKTIYYNAITTDLGFPVNWIDTI